MLALPFPGEAAEQHQRRALGEARARQRVGADQQVDALDRGVAAHVEEHRAAAGEGLQLGRGIGDAARIADRAPALRRVDQVAAPVREAVDRAAVEDGRVEAVGDLDAAVVGNAEQAIHALVLARRERDQPLAASGPLAHPPRPRLRVVPAGRRAGLDLLEHQELGAVDVAHHRHVGGHARRGLVDRRQVVQVQDVGLARPRLLQPLRPELHQPLVGGIVDAREDGVGGVLAVLVGRMHRRLDVERVVDRAHVEPGVEVARVAVPPGLAERAGEHGDVPAVGGERAGERTCDLR